MEIFEINATVTPKQQHAKQSAILIEQYTSLVKKIARHLLYKLPQTILLDDLIQAGMIGLLEAATNYDLSKGASFETYAGIRIRGAMLDEVRSNDWVPRSVHRNARNIATAAWQVENRAGRDARDYEVAQELGVSLTEYHQMLQSSAATQLHPIDNVITVDRKIEPDNALQREDLYTKLIAIIDILPDKYRMVLSLYYDQELNLKEIGTILQVSESRVCQIHTQAMQRIKAQFHE